MAGMMTFMIDDGAKNEKPWRQQWFMLAGIIGDFHPKSFVFDIWQTKKTLNFSKQSKTEQNK